MNGNRNRRLFVVLAAFLLGVLCTTVLLLFFFGNLGRPADFAADDGGAPAEAEPVLDITFDELQPFPYYEVEDENFGRLRSVDGRTFYGEDGAINSVEALSGSVETFIYYDEDGDAFGSFDGLIYFNNEGTTAYVVDNSGQLVPSRFPFEPPTDRSANLADFAGDISFEAEKEGYRGQGDLLYRDPQSFLRIPALNDFDFGDVDGDGDLDLAIGRNRHPNQIYLNVGGVYSLTWTAPVTSTTKAVEWGDMDGDGDLDLAVGNRSGENVVYLNENGRLHATPIWKDNRPNDNTNDLLWGDMDGDGWLDLVVGNGSGAPNRIYLNNGMGMLEERAEWPAEDAESTDAALETILLDLGRFDSDNALDLALAIQSSETQEGVIVYQNTLQSNGAMTQVWQGGKAPVLSVAWGDVDEAQDEQAELAVADTSAGGDGVLGNVDGRLDENIWRPEIDGLALDAAWGDVNGDGLLDLAIALSANGHERIYLNEGGSLAFTPAWTSDGFGHARKVELVDLDNDRDLDLVAHYGQQLSVYLNRSAPFSSSVDNVDLFQPGDESYAIDLADLNQDGFVDVAVGNSGLANRGAANYIYFNDNGNLFAGVPIMIGTAVSQTTGLAWGDANGDGLPDLAVANDGTFNELYIAIEVAGQITLDETPRTFPHTENSKDIIWGDVDGDGDLDLAVANSRQPNRIYLNDGTGNFSDSFQFGFVGGSEAGFSSTRLDFGDVDADGDLDLAVANFLQPNQIFTNVNGRFSDQYVQFIGNSELSQGIAWGDYDGDGRIDLAVANKTDPNQLYWNAGGYLYPVPVWESGDIDDSHNLAWGDADGDGDLDLAVANRGGFEQFAPIPNKLYLNVNGTLQTAREETLWNSATLLPTLDLAWGDIDQDGDFDLVFGNGQRILNSNPLNPNQIGNELYLNDLVPINVTKPGANPAAIAIEKLMTEGTRLPLLDTQAVVVQNGRLDITYRLSHPQNAPYHTVRGFYSLDGGNTFLPAKPVTGTAVTNLSSTPGQNSHTYAWDIYQSGFFGASNSVVFRLEGYEVADPVDQTPNGTYRYPDQPGLDAQRSIVAVNTFPLRVRGNQVQVLFECDEESKAERPCLQPESSDTSEPLENAVVFGLPANQSVGANVLQSLTGQLFGTDGQGYLQGRTILSQDDQLISLWPVPTETLEITFTNRTRLFYMSAPPTEEGVNSTSVETLSGVQTITVSNQNPLMLVDLIVSIEWDASQDVAFMAALQTAFERASEILFDVTNGQVAIGNVYIFHAKTYWNLADIVIVANNDLRPSAAIGGVVNTPMPERVFNGRTPDANDTQIISEAYLPGQIRMGPNWDPFGQNQAELTEDWYRAMAHELAHYIFFLPDDYLGLEDGVLRRIDCQGSFMTTTRDPAYSEFLTESKWLETCTQSLAEQTTGRNDWQTIQEFYPFLNAPEADEELDGPSILPLNVTQLVSFGLDYGAERERLPTRIFEIKGEAGERIRVPNAAVYLIQTQGSSTPTDDLLINLGSTGVGGDRVQVRGAFAGDLLCLSDESQKPPLQGCELLDAADVSIRLFEQEGTGWEPKVEARAVSTHASGITQTLLLTITQPLQEGEAMEVQLFSAHYASFPGNEGASPTAVINTPGDIHHISLNMLRPEFDVTIRLRMLDDTHREQITQFILKPTWESDTFVVPKVITIPITSNLTYHLIGRPNNVPIGGPNNVPIGGPNNVPIGGPNNVPIGGPNNVPIGGPNNVPIGGPNNVPIGGPNNVPIGGPNNVPIGGPNNVPIGGPNNVPIGGPNNVPIGGPNNVPIGGPNNVPIGGAEETAAFAPILSADAQVIIYNNFGFFEDSGVESLQLLTVAPQVPNWFVQVGQAYRVSFNTAITDERTIAFSYLQKDVPQGFETTLYITFLPEGSTQWQLLPTRQFVENLVVADVVADETAVPINGVYAVISTIELPALQNGWNLLAYPLPVTRSVEVGLGSIFTVTEAVVTAVGNDLTPPSEQSATNAQLTPLVNVHVRTGPSIENDVLSYLLSGETAGVLQYEPDANWQQIQCPPRSARSSGCWVTGRPQYVTISGETAVPSDTETLQFGRVYWVLVEGLADGESIIPYLAPPTLAVDGEQR